MSSSDDKKWEQQRRHFRIRFPDAEKPTFECKGKKYLIVDVSEQGLAIHITPGDSLTKVTAELKGTITFKDGETVAITCKILRCHPEHIIFNLMSGVPLATIMRQQRILLQKFGNLNK